MVDQFVTVCPFCHGTEMIEAFQGGYACVSAANNIFRSAGLYHSICRQCGSVVRSYVKKPEELLKRRDRKDY